jgi:molecular chaperone GrpE
MSTESQSQQAEPTNGAPPAPESPSQVSALQDENEKLRKRVDDLARAYQASEADREDFKHRLNRERDRLLEVEKANIALMVIEAIDELDLTLSAADTSPLAVGVRLVRENLLKKVQERGIERLHLEGTRYDPQTAEAFDTELTTEPAEDERVVSVIRAGYKLKDRVIRPARVKVARYMRPAQA